MNVSDEWDRITPKLFGYLINTMRDKAVAEDLLQTTWLKALKSLPRFQRKGKGFEAWIFAIAHNECRQHWRATGREIPLDPLIHDVPDISLSSPDNLFIEQVLRKLSEDDRELLRLRYIADLSLSDLARILNINFVTVRVRVHRALARARSLAMTQNHDKSA